MHDLNFNGNRFSYSKVCKLKSERRSGWNQGRTDWGKSGAKPPRSLGFWPRSRFAPSICSVSNFWKSEAMALDPPPLVDTPMAGINPNSSRINTCTSCIGSIRIDIPSNQQTRRRLSHILTISISLSIRKTHILFVFVSLLFAITKYLLSYFFTAWIW